MATLHYRGRGNVHLAEIVNGVIGAYKYHICPDNFSVDLDVTTGEHINKCGLVDVPDDAWDVSADGTMTLNFVNVEDVNFALAVLGTVTPAQSGSVSVAETIPDLEPGDIYFLGGAQRHRGITLLALSGGMVLTTNYLLDAATGKLTAVTAIAASPPITCTYTFADPASVSMLTTSSKNYAVMFESMNRQNGNALGSVELYKVRLSPAKNMDFMSDGLQTPSITGKVLADTDRSDTDLEFGQFGRRVGA